MCQEIILEENTGLLEIAEHRNFCVLAFFRRLLRTQAVYICDLCS
jgi:hypothetical protein